MQGRCTLGRARLSFSSYEAKTHAGPITLHSATVSGDMDNIIIDGNRCHLVSGPESAVLHVDYLHINTALSADIEITDPSRRACHAEDGTLVLQINPTVPEHTRSRTEERIMGLHEQIARDPQPARDRNFIESLIENVAEGTPFADKQCSICQETYKEREWHTFLPCAHGYHSNCVQEWIKQSETAKCPECNRNIYIET
jgi:hypothetical protein